MRGRVVLDIETIERRLRIAWRELRENRRAGLATAAARNRLWALIGLRRAYRR